MLRTVALISTVRKGSLARSSSLALLVLCLSSHAGFSFAGQERISYSYDALGRLTQVTDDRGTSIVYAYDPSGNMLSRQVELEEILFFFPFYQAGTRTFLGIAVSNFSTARAAELRFTAFNRQGAVPALGKNPRLHSIPAQSQYARLGSEIFEIGAGQPQDFWVELASNSADLGSFFQFGDLTLTQLDGSVAFDLYGREFYLTRVYQGNASFKGQRALTSLSLANPTEDEVTVRLRLYLPEQVPRSGDPVPAASPAAERTEVIPPRGFLYKRADEIFSRNSIAGGYVEGRVLGKGGLAGFALIELPDRRTVIGLNASVGNRESELYSAQLADFSTIYTSLRLVNTGDLPRSVRITPVAGDGKNLKAPKELELGLQGQAELDMGQFFGFPSSTAMTVGSIKIEADGPGIIGDVLFGDPVSFKYAAAMPLQTERIRRAVFSQVANLTSFFTGLAFYNPGSEPAEIAIRVYSATGALIGKEATVPLPAGNRFSKLVQEIVQMPEGHAGGYIVIESNQPIIAQQIFGESHLNQFSAVPPRILE